MYTILIIFFQKYIKIGGHIQKLCKKKKLVSTLKNIDLELQTQLSRNCVFF